MDNVKNDVYYVKKMLKDISFILDNTKGITLEQLTNNEILCDSVLFRLIQISENSVKLTAEFKEAYGKYYDPYPLLPDFYMNVSQAPNFIMEFPHEIHKSVANYYKSLEECIKEIEKMDKFPAEFRTRATALLQKQ